MFRTARSAVTAALAILSFSSHAALMTYQSSLGPETPGATGSGIVTVRYDPLAHTLDITSSWSGLTGATTVAHIHCCVVTPGTGTAGVAVAPGSLPGFPGGLSAGGYVSPLIDLTNAANFGSGFLSGPGGGTVAGAEAALIAGLDNGTAYFNIHTSVFPAGEIRGFPRAVPEPATLSLAALGLAGLGFGRRKHALAATRPA